MVCFFVFQLVKVVLVSIRTKFELSMCLVCPTIEINVCSAYLQNGLVRFCFFNIVDLRTLPCYARAVLKIEILILLLLLNCRDFGDTVITPALKISSE